MMMIWWWYDDDDDDDELKKLVALQGNSSLVTVHANVGPTQKKEKKGRDRKCQQKKERERKPQILVLSTKNA